MSKINLCDNNWDGIEITNSKLFSAILSIAHWGELKNAPELLVYPSSLDKTSDKLGESAILTIKQALYDAKNKCTYLKICTGNVMGFIGYNDTEIRIHSRFDKKDNDIEKDADDFLLYHMLAKIFHVNLFNLDTTSSRKNNILDLLMVMFPQMLKDAMSQGLYKEYRTYQYNDARVRGTIEVNRFIREDIPFQGKVAYRTREFSHDNKLLQLVRHTIEYMRHHPWGHGLLNNDMDTRSYVLQIVNATPTYTKRDRLKVLNDNRRPVSHPYYTKYRALQQLCISILRHDGLQYGDEKDKVHGILFDGAWLWEEYLDTLLRRLNFSHPKNKESLGALQLFEDDKNLPYNRNMYPDFYSEERRCVLDAKYKHVDYGIQRNDLYQVIAYMHTMKYEVGGYLYPYSKQADFDPDSQKNQKFKLVNDTGVLYTIPFYVPQGCKDWADFCTQMHNEEEAFLSRVDNPESYSERPSS